MARACRSYPLLVRSNSRVSSTIDAHDDTHRVPARHHRCAAPDARRLLALLLAGCPSRDVPGSGYRPASHASRRSAPCLAGRRRCTSSSGLCLLPQPSGWTPDLERLLPLRVLSFAASCRQRFEAGSRAPLRDFGAPCATASLGAGLASATNAARSVGPSLRLPPAFGQCRWGGTRP